MHQISKYLDDEYDCYFSQLFGNKAIEQWVIDQGVLNNTILGGKFRQQAEAYMEEHGLRNDYAMRRYNNKYDLVYMCNDMMVAKSIRDTKSIYVQEGMIDKIDWRGKMVKAFSLPRYLAFNTALNGASNKLDIFCAASEGYKDYLSKMGTDRDKIIVTGIPNFDNAQSFLNNDFPHKGYVMVATSDIREIFGKEDRVGNIKKWVAIANGRPMLFKLHPNEVYERAYAEIVENTPEGTLIFQSGNTNHMVANCEELITQWSTVVYVGMALGKKVHSYFDMDELKRLQPIQNGGKSAERIANIGRQFMAYKGDGKSFLKQFDAEKSFSLN